MVSSLEQARRRRQLNRRIRDEIAVRKAVLPNSQTPGVVDRRFAPADHAAQTPTGQGQVATSVASPDVPAA